jgi:O-succinylbenzoic acid--CoA ligase
LGEWNDGRLRILGRIDDVIVTGGLKITPTRLEAAIAGVPAVAEAVVVGIPDPEWGQRVAAVVVAVDPKRPPGLDDLQRACTAAGIGDAFLPRWLTLVDGLPSRGPGKPDRAAATALAGAELARAAPSPR